MRKTLSLFAALTEDFVFATQRRKVARAHANIRKVLTIGTALPPLQRSESQHSYEHSPPASLQAFKYELASSQTALVEHPFLNSLVVVLPGSLNSRESVPQ